MADNLITQVSQDSYSRGGYERQNNVDYDSKIHLNVRNHQFTITRDELMSLPESILLCLFPNGVFLDRAGQAITNLTEDDTVFVNFEPSCFEYIINTFGKARQDLVELNHLHAVSLPALPGLSPQVSKPQSETAASVLQNKPAIIVLREDLDYYVIPPLSGFDADNVRHCKLAVAQYLLTNKQIFSGLGYDPQLDPLIHQHLGAAEQHLLDMLCASGFQTTGHWGSRSLEPGKCVVLSLSLVRLQNQPPVTPGNNISGTDTPPESPLLMPVASNASVSSTARKSRSRIASLASSASRAASRSLSKSRKSENTNHSKLLLFWRKPARKCWWSNETIEIDVQGMVVNGVKYDKLSVKVHIRRVWTLELSVIGVQ